jgi:hypothetical protein
VAGSSRTALANSLGLANQLVSEIME